MADIYKKDWTTLIIHRKTKDPLSNLNKLGLALPQSDRRLEVMKQTMNYPTMMMTVPAIILLIIKGKVDAQRK
jgi:hypothetical protein